MAKLMPEEVTLMDVADMAHDREHRTATTRFNSEPGRQRYVGAAVPWKMNPEAMPPEVKAGLEKAKKISKDCGGIKGTAINPLTGGLVPQKVICQLKKAGKIKEK
jgi:hypothetical protein